MGYGTIDFHSTKGRSDLSDYKLDGFTVKDYTGKVRKEVSLSYVFSSSPTYRAAVEYSDDLKHRMFLKRITEKDGAGGTVRSHDFDYDDINALPPRLSYAQDHWGYFNGVNNASSYPVNLAEKNDMGESVFVGVGGDRELHTDFTGKGMLKKITWPTGGTSTFVYGPHTYHTQQVVQPTPTGAQVFCSGDEGPLPVVKSVRITSPSSQLVVVHAYTHLLADYTSTQSTGTLTITDGFGSRIVDKVLILDNAYTGYIQLAPNVEYIFTLSADMANGQNNTMNYMSFEYYATLPVLTPKNVPTGGMRINEVIHYDPDQKSTEKIRYYYARHDQLTKSSGETRSQPDYVTRYFVRQPCGLTWCNTWDCNYVALHTDNMNSLFPTSNNIYYKYVTIGRGENMEAGAEEHQFTVSFDSPGTQRWGEDYFENTPLSNTAWDNGKETDTRYFASRNGSLTLLKHTSNKYIQDPRHHREVPNLIVRKKWNPQCQREAVFQCNDSNINETYKSYGCKTDHNHVWHYAWYVGNFICKASGANMGQVTFQLHPCYGKQPGDTAVALYALDYLDAFEYLNISDWVYLDKTTETTYDENGQNPVVRETDYVYDNDQHQQLSRMITSTSEGKTVETSIKYPPDYAETGNVTIPALLDKHIINVPVKKETVLAGSVVDGQVALYNEKGQVERVYNYESATYKPPTTHNPETFIPSSDYKLKKMFGFDPATGNISKVQSMDNFSTLYLWGYKNTLPVAEIKDVNQTVRSGQFATPNNAFHTSFEEDGQIDSSPKTGRNVWSGAYNVVIPGTNGNYTLSYWKRSGTGPWTLIEENISVTTGAVQTKTIGDSQGKIDEVRLYPAGAHMTTFTYDPLVGISSIMDPNNLTTKFTYDAFGRLSSVIDDKGNVLKSNVYHYKDHVSDLNYVKEYTASKEGVSVPEIYSLPVEEKSLTTTFLDGLGRSMQVVHWKSTTSLKDHVLPIRYEDNIGRKTTHYLPYASDGVDGSYKVDALSNPSTTATTEITKYRSGKQYEFYQGGGVVTADQYPYSETIHESSPLDRISKQGFPGAAWQPKTNSLADRSVKREYLTNGEQEVILFRYNTTTESIMIGETSAEKYYPARSLTVEKSLDEHNNETLAYTDKEGRIVCKKVQYKKVFDVVRYVSTYYLYDDFNNLLAVVPPSAVDLLTR